MIPIKTTENESFKRLLKIVDPWYEIHNLKYFSHTAIPWLYSEWYNKIQHKTQNVLFFATVSDLWSSCTSEPYLSLTINFIHDWELCSVYFSQDRTWELTRPEGSGWMLGTERRQHDLHDAWPQTVGLTMWGPLSWTCLQCFGHRLILAIGEWNKNKILPLAFR